MTTADRRTYNHLFKQIARRSSIKAVFPYCVRACSNDRSSDEPPFGLEHYGAWAPVPALGEIRNRWAAR